MTETQSLYAIFAQGRYEQVLEELKNTKSPSTDAQTALISLYATQMSRSHVEAQQLMQSLQKNAEFMESPDFASHLALFELRQKALTGLLDETDLQKIMQACQAESPWLKGRAHGILTHIAYAQGKLEEVIQHSIKAMKYFELAQNWAEMAYYKVRLAYFSYMSLKAEITMRYLQDVIADVQRYQLVSNEVLLAAHSTMAQVYYMHNDLENTRQQITLWFELFKSGQALTMVTGYSKVFEILLNIRDFALAQEMLSELRYFAESAQVEHLIQELPLIYENILKIEEAQEAKNIAQLKSLLEYIQSRKEQYLELSLGRYHYYLQLLLLYAYLSEYEQAQAYLTEFVSQYPGLSQSVYRMDGLIFQAALDYQQGNTDRAVQSMQAILHELEKTGYIRLLINNRVVPEKLVFEALQACKQSDTPLSEAFVAKLDSLFERQVLQHEDLLTERELEILVCFQAGKSNREIAEELFISINTVKYHGKNINLKLEVDSRQAAIEKAKSLLILK